jgi:hypothetical protein
MEPFAYLSVLTSIVLALGIAGILACLAVFALVFIAGLIQSVRYLRSVAKKQD